MVKNLPERSSKIKETIFIFIDESGTLPDSQNKIVVLAAVASTNSKVFQKILQKIKNSKSKRKNTELKFYSSGDKTRTSYLVLLEKSNTAIFVLAIKKGSQKIADSPENYAVLSWLLLIDCLAYFPGKELNIIFDRHFHRSRDETQFYEVLRRLLHSSMNFTSADSQIEPGVNAADMVAGAFLYAMSGKTPTFYEIIKNKVISQKIINWKEAKEGFLQAQKKLA